MDLKVEDKLILSCIKIFPDESELEKINSLIPNIQDWDYLIRTIIDRGIGPLFYTKLALLSNSQQIPEYFKTKLKHAYYKTFSRSTILYEHFRKIVEVFNLNNIPVIALKGIFLSEWLYNDIGLRQFSDIDLLVKEENGKRCIAILEQLGYKKQQSDKLSFFVESQFDIVHYSPMILNGVSIEIHIKLHQNTESYNVIVTRLWENSNQSIINGVQVYSLAINDLLIYLCLHLDKHFRSGHIQFTCFNDITNIVEVYSKSIDWHAFKETCQLFNCEDILYKYLVLIHKYMNAPVPNDIIHNYLSLLTEKDEQMFLCYLKGNSFSKNYFQTHLKILKKIQNFSGKVKYIRDVLLPSKSFMIQSYHISNKSLVYFYYPYRYYIGALGLVAHFLKRK
jgi:hypothetical protein